MYTISKEFHFSASHVLNGLKENHPCSRMHGHNYIVICQFKSDSLNDKGFIIDYRDLQPIKDFIDSALDHKHLNDFLPFNPTAENIAKHLYILFVKTFPQLYSVSVKETDKTMATYYD